MKRALFLLLLTVACGADKASKSKPAAAPSGSGSGSGSADCPATLNCMPPTNDENPLCRMPETERKQRCPNTQVDE